MGNWIKKQTVLLCGFNRPQQVGCLLPLQPPPGLHYVQLKGNGALAVCLQLLANLWTGRGEHSTVSVHVCACMRAHVCVCV